MTKLERKAFELRWYYRKGFFDSISPHLREKVGTFLDHYLDNPRQSDAPTEAACQKWIPFAEKISGGKVRGTYAMGYPQGAAVHWTAGHRNGLSEGGKYMSASRMLYLLIDAEGKVGQSFPLDQWGYHTGESSYDGLPGSVANELIGTAGVLREHGGHFYPWWDRQKIYDPKTGDFVKHGDHQFLPRNRIPRGEVVTVRERRENVFPGHYHRLTEEQFRSLVQTLVWLYQNNPDVFSLDLVLGHDEVSPGRKVDPGGALVDEHGQVLTMSQFRDRLKKEVQMVKGG